MKLKTFILTFLMMMSCSILFGQVAKIGETYYATLAEAVVAAQTGETVTLLSDITASDIITINKAITLDGNGKKLTSTAGRAINVNCEGNVGIKNLTIDASGERAINVIQKPANVTVDNVTATAANYTVNVASSAPEAVVAISNSILNGLCTVNVSAAGSQVTVNNSTVNCNDNNTTAGESYAALCLNKDAVGASIVATNSTINVTEGSDSTKGRNGAENGTVTINGSTDGVDVMVAVITYEGSDYYYSFATLAEAVEFAKAGDVVSLIRDITASNIITINKAITFDGNGKTLTSTAGRAINVSGADGVTIKNLTINASGERAINIIQNATNVTIDGVTATAANYTVNVAGSATAAVVAIKNSTLNGLCTVNVAAAGSQVTVDYSTVNCNDNNTTAGESYAALCLNKDAVGGSIVATNSTINVTEGSDSMKGRNGAENGTVTINGSIDGVAVMVAVITYEGSDYYYSFATLAEAVEFAKAGNVVSLIRDITASDIITINKAITLDLNGKKVTSTAKKAFEVHADATIKNGTIEAAQRCVDTRKAVNLTLTDVTLIADEYTTHGNPQPLTIGGSENGTKVVMTNVNISAADGYGIITFVETELTATNSTIGGYNALYVKPGSDNSTFNFVDSDLSGSTEGNDVEGNSFSVIAVRAKDVIVNVDDASTVTAKGNYSYAISFKSKSGIDTPATGSSVTVAGTITGNILADLNGNTVKVKLEYADVLLAEGYATTEADANGLVEVSGLIGAVAQIGDVEYTTLQEAENAAKDGETIVLLEDIVLDGMVTFFNSDNTRMLTLNMNNKTITMSDDWDNTTAKSAFWVCDGLTIIGNGTINADPANKAAVYAIIVGHRTAGTTDGNAGTLVIENGTFYGNDASVISVTNGIATINGGTFESPGEFDLNCIDDMYVADKANITVYGGTFVGFNPENNAAEGSNTNFCAEGYAALPNLDGNFIVGTEPTATVNNLGRMTIPAGEYSIWNGSFDQNTEDDGDMPLSFVMQFLADQNEGDMATSPFADWYGDFVLTFSGIENGSFNTDGCYLAGHYGSFGWVKIPVEGLLSTINEGQRYPVMLGVGLGQKYDYICSSVEDFKCALYLTPEILAANPNIQVNLELAIVDNSQGEAVAASALIENENVYKVVDYNYDAIDFNKDYVARIGNAGYTTLAAAVEAANADDDEDEVVLLKDVTIESKIDVTKSLVLNGNNKTLTYTGSDRAIDVRKETYGANLTVRNLTINCAANWCERGINYNTTGTLTLDGVTIEGKTNKSINYGVNFPGYADEATAIIINSKITNFIPINIWGSKMNVTITDSEIYSYSTSNDNGGGIVLNIDAEHSAEGTQVNMTGGKLHAYFIDDENNYTPGYAVRKEVNNTTLVYISNTTDVYGTIENGLTVATVRYGDSPYFYSYETLKEAVEKAILDYSNGITNVRVEVVKDAEGSGIFIEEDLNLNLTIDFKNHTYTFTEPAVGSTGTESQGFHIEKGNKITLKNGILNVAETAGDAFAMLIQNYADLTITDMTLDGDHLDRNNYSYVLSVNCGNVVIDGSTSILANKVEGEKHFAFDSYDYNAGGYTELPVVTVNTTGDIKGAVEVSATLNITNLGEGSEISYISIDGKGQLFHNGLTTTIKKHITGHPVPENNSEYVDGWYTISSPVGTVRHDKVDGLLNGTHDLYRYDEPTMMWENVKNNEHTEDFTTLEAGRGYIYANTANTTLSFTGDLVVEAVEQNITATDNDLKGFNLVGNPFTHNITLDHISGANLAAGFYTLTNEGAWNANNSTTGVINALQGALIKTTETKEVQINPTAVSKSRSVNNGQLEINVSNANYNDVAYVTFNKGIGLDKIEHRNANIPMVYVPVNGTNYAVAIMSNDVTEIPVSFVAKTMGEYTIGVEAQDCEYAMMTLVDRFTGIETNLLIEDYTFIAKSNDSAERFIIKLAMDNSNGEANENFAFINNGMMYIYNIEGQGMVNVYDVTGRPVAEYNVATSANISTSDFAAGVYIIRMSDENGVKTQKIVIE